MTKRMTRGEQLVWAAVYARTLNISNPPDYLFMPHAVEVDGLRDWELVQTQIAVSAATVAVNLLREVLDCVIDNNGKRSDTAVMCGQMTNSESKPRSNSYEHTCGTGYCGPFCTGWEP